METASITLLDDHFRGGMNLNGGARSPKAAYTLQEILHATFNDIGALNDVTLTPFLETLLSAYQLIDGASGGIAPAMILSITGLPTAADTFTIDDGASGAETYTFVAGAPGAFEIQIGGTVAATMANMVTSIMANSVRWNAYTATSLDRFFASAYTTQVLLSRKAATATGTDRVYATLTGVGTIQIVEFVTEGENSYEFSAATEGAIPVSDPGVGHFGFGRLYASLRAGEVHAVLDSTTVFAWYWEDDSQAWKRFGFLGYTQAELNSITGGSEGASLIGTDSKTNLGASTTVEAAMTNLDTKNPPARSSQAGTPNAGPGTAGAIGDIDVDTTADVFYFNPDAGATTWIALASQAWVTALVHAGVAWRETLLSANQLVDGAAGGIAPAMLLAFTGQPDPTNTLTIDDGLGGAEVYTAVAGAPAAFEFQIGGTVNDTMTNLAASIMANSVLWNGYSTVGLDRFFASLPTSQVMISRKLAAASADDRVYATLTGAGAIQVVDFVTAAQDDYDFDAATEAAIDAADPGTGQFGVGRVLASLKGGETHNVLESATVTGYTWEDDAQAWRRSMVLGYSQAELNSITGGSEGASLIGTDAKANLGASTDVEACLTDLDTKNPPARVSQAGTPNAGPGTAGAIGDVDVDTTADVFYFNPDGGATSWIALASQDWTTALVRSGIAWRETLLSSSQLIDGVAGGVSPAMLVAITGQPDPANTFTIDDGLGGAEIYTAVAGAPGAWQFQIGGTVNDTMTNLAAAITSSSAIWKGESTTGLDAFFASVPAVQVLIARIVPATSCDDRVYATLTGAGAMQVVDFVTIGEDDYDFDAATEAAIDAADPGTGQFGMGRLIGDLSAGETHNVLESATILGCTWEDDAQAWRRSLVLGYSQAELNSTAGGSEGASLVGTDAKANLGASTDVEGCLADLDTKNPPTRSSQASSPVGAVVPAGVGDINVDTAAEIVYLNTEGTAYGWRATNDEDLGAVAVVDLVQAGVPVIGQLLTVGADVYEADGGGLNINFVIAAAEATMDNLLAAAVTFGTENLYWDKIDATHLRIRSADGPQGTVIAVDPGIAIAYNLANYTLSTGTPGNVNTLSGRAAGLSKTAVASVAVTANHVAVGVIRFCFDFTPARFMVQIRTAAGALKMAVTDPFTINNGDILVTLVGGGGDIAATDVVTVQAWS